ncbi:MAG: hypothetical protein J0H78_10575 [Rhizobiales bacterium]|nr:hypothetical protein [Hyphomicrobiales bacterium]
MWSFFKDWFWDIDEPSDRVGWFGAAILGAFTLFCVYMWIAYGGRH